MTVTTLTTKPLWRTLLVDAALAGAVCLIPWLHVYAPWAVALNPMLFLLLAGMILVPGRGNAFFLALLLPVFSAIVVGMPTPAKAVCMAAEFSAVVAVYGFAAGAKGLMGRPFLGMLVAMLSGKVVYYGLKAILIVPAVLVGTDVWMQVGSMLLWAGLFSWIVRKPLRGK